MHRLAAFLLLFSLTILPGTLLADTVTIAASADNSMYGEDGTLSNGAGDHFFTGTTDQQELRRALIRFDIDSALPTGATVTAVTLTLHLSRTKATAQTVAIHRVNTAWGEGTSDAPDEEGKGAPATSGDATWTHAMWSTDMWSSAGGDFDATATATANVGKQNGFYSWSGGTMVSDVQSWLDTPSTNFGWIIVGNESSPKTAQRFDSRTHPTQSQHPKLVVEFTPPPSTGACCAVDGTCTVVNHPGTTCGGNYQGQGTDCQSTACPQPTGACCLPDASATCVEVEETDCLAQSGTFRGALTTCSNVDCPVVLTPFVDALPIPKVATPLSGTSGGQATYEMSMVELDQQLHRDLPATKVWGYDDGTGGTFPGPTLETSSGAPITVTWKNDLRDDTNSLRQDHVLSVDTCLHGAMNQAPRTVVHLHGGHVPEAVDGYPESTFLPGNQAVYDYPNNQDAASLWYHDHALGITRLNVYMGLAGMYVIRDANSQSLGLPAGGYDVPLVIQDRTFAPDGSLVYPTSWQQHFHGDTVLVNGKVWPYLDVDQGKYRFRILNGSNSRTYDLALSDGSSFQVIGTDGGLLESPVTVSNLVVTPGERYDVIIDFSGYSAGDEVFFENSAPAPYPGTSGVGVIPDVMKFVVGSQTGHTTAIPSTLRTINAPDEANSVMSRDLELAKTSDTCTGSVWLINGLGWDDITEKPQLGTTEVWRFINRSGFSHPMHMHLVFFKVLDRQEFEEVNGTISPIGSPVPPAPEEAGWKDTVDVGPDEIVRVIARFEDYVGKYAYHCHILEHEDHEMMRQFETFTICGDGHRGMPDEECDDGNLIDGDGCDSNCTPTSCGNGVADPSEECDDGNSTDGDGCDSNCTVTACGNGIVTSGEDCDDGNLVDGDGCDSNCTITACGNGIQTGTEECDDGNLIDGDGCESDCTLPDTGDMGTGDMGTRDMGTADMGTADMGTADTGTADMGTADMGTADMGTADMGTADMGTADMGTADMGTADMGTADTGTTDMGTADTGTTDMGTEDMGGDVTLDDTGGTDTGTGADTGTAPGDDVDRGSDEGCCRVVDSGHVPGWWIALIAMAFAVRIRRRRR